MTPSKAGLRSALLAALLAVAGTANAQQTLIVYNWNDYIDESTLADFQKETGLHVDYRTFESDAEYQKLLAERAPMDVVHPSVKDIGALIEQKAIVAINSNKEISDFKEFAQLVRGRLQTQDPHNEYAVPYLGGAVGIALRNDLVTAALGDTPVIASWDMLFSQEYKEKLGSCGMSMLDAPDEVAAIYLNYRGAMVSAASARTVKRYMNRLQDDVTGFKNIDNAEYIEGLAAGTTCAAMVWEGDAYFAKEEGHDVSFIQPQEGTIFFLDTMAVPAHSANKDAAIKYIQFMNRQDIAERNAMYTLYRSPHQNVQTAIEDSRAASGFAHASSSYKNPLFGTPKMTEAWKAQVALSWDAMVASYLAKKAPAVASVTTIKVEKVQ